MSGPGWYEFDGIWSSPVPAGNTVIPFKDGIQITTDGCGAVITFAGEVLAGAGYPITLNYEGDDAKYTWTGNCTPVNRQLKDFSVYVPEAAGGVLWGETSVEVYTLGADGQTGGHYCYIDEYLALYGGYPVAEPGWYEFEGSWSTPVPAGDVWVNSGDTLQITTDGCGAVIVVPLALED